MELKKQVEVYRDRTARTRQTLTAARVAVLVLRDWPTTGQTDTQIDALCLLQYAVSVITKRTKNKETEHSEETAHQSKMIASNLI